MDYIQEHNKPIPSRIPFRHRDSDIQTVWEGFITTSSQQSGSTFFVVMKSEGFTSASDKHFYNAPTVSNDKRNSTAFRKDWFKDKRSTNF